MARLRLRLPGIALVLGALAAFGQAPYDLPLVLVLSMAGVVWLSHKANTPGQAALMGWAFGAGYFSHTLRWIVSPFMVQPEIHGWMAPFALVLMGAGMALFWGAAFWAARRLSHRAWPLILCWPAVELIRAYVFTGFPWAMPSQALVDGIAGQALAWVGPYALNLWLVAAAVCLGHAGQLSWRWRAAQAAVAAVVAALLVLPPSAGPAALTGHVIRLIQPNAPQRDKWNPDKILLYFERQLDDTAAPAARMPELVIWSETAIAWSLDNAGAALEEIAAAGGAAPVALGVQRSQDGLYYNSLAVLGPGGSVDQLYDKHHLVPFGEYMPFGAVLSRFGIHGMAAQEGFGFTAGPGARLLEFGPLGRALPLICYEAVFPHDINAAPERPDFLIQITNDAWFGKDAGPEQHLAQARMRAIEQGLPLARAANTGISAMIDPSGRVTASLPLNTAGFVDADLPAPLPPTLYSRGGDLPFALVLLAGLLAAALSRRRRFAD